MTIRIAAWLLFLACSLALTSLSAADPAAEAATKPAAALTRPDQSGHPLPEGEGWKLPTHISRPIVSDDTWHTSFNERLDKSIDRLRTDDAKKRSGVLAVTGVGGSVDLGRAPFATASVGPEKEIARLLQEHGLPPGLTSVVAVESAFNPLALSPKGARGLWQLMPETARRYGLKVEPNEDERTNPLKSTNAAAAYIKDLYAQFRDWPLVLAAYNAGEDRVARAMARTGAGDFWSLRRHAALPEETLQYVPAVLTKLEEPLPTPQFQIHGSVDWNGENESNKGRLAYASPAVK